MQKKSKNCSYQFDPLKKVIEEKENNTIIFCLGYMHKTFNNIITTTITISIAVIFLISGIQNSFEQENNIGNWRIGASDKLSFKYPSQWNVNVSDSRFDNYELLFRDQANNATIQVSDEAISATNKFLMGNDPQKYLDIYMMSNSPLSSDNRKIETYPKGKVPIAGLPAYSELYLDQGYAILISLAFPEGNDRHYTVFSASPASNYDKLEPTMLEIIKLITPKAIQNPLDKDSEIPPKSKDFSNIQGNATDQLKEECLSNFKEDICNYLFR